MSLPGDMKCGETCGLTQTSITGVKYVCSGCMAAAVQCTTEKAEVEVPEWVIVKGSKYMVRILARGLFSRSSVRRAVIPKTVRILPDKCFAFCENLSHVVFEDGSQVISLGKCCFKSCSLCEFDLASSCIVIGAKCFEWCGKLCRISISEGSKLRRIGSFAFRGCKISSIFLPSQLQLSGKESSLCGVKRCAGAEGGTFVILDDCVLSKSGKTMFHCFSSKSLFEVPDSVRTISSFCFSDSEVKTVVFGNWSAVKDLSGVFSGSSVESVVFRNAFQADNYFFVEDGLVFRSAYGKIRLITQLVPTAELVISEFVSEVCTDFSLHPESLKSVKFDPKCQHVNIWKGAFRGTSLTEVSMYGVEELSSKCFLGCKILKSVNFPGTTKVNKFGKRAFSLSGIECISVPKCVRSIESKCFYGCSMLKELIFEEGSLLERIGSKAFMNTGITRLVVPPSVVDVNGTSFYSVTEPIVSENGTLEMSNGLLIDRTTQTLIYVAQLDECDVVIPWSVICLGPKSFYRLGHIHSISFAQGSELKRIDDSAFKHCEIDELCLPRSLSSLGLSVSNHVKKISIGDGSPYFNTSDALYLTRIMKGGDVSLVNALSRDAIHVPDYVSVISTSCFCHRRGAFSVSFSASELCEVVAFEDNAFCESDIVSVSIPPSIESIGMRCLYGCPFLLTVSFHRGCRVKSFGAYCFGSSVLSRIVIPLFVQAIPDGCFYHCKHLESVSFEEGNRLSDIGRSSFEHCVSLTDCCIPCTVERIFDRAFHETQFSEIVLPPSLLSLTCDCFAASQVEAVAIPANVSKIENGAFKHCHRLASVTFENGSCLESIEDSAFCWTSISEITLPGGFCSIGKKAFRGTHINRIVLPRSLEELGDRAFANCTKLKSFSFADDAAIAVVEGEDILAGTSDCEITIPESVAYFDPTFLPDGCRVRISSENKFFVCDDHFVYSSDHKTLVRCFRSEPQVVIPRFITQIGEKCFNGCRSICAIQFEEGSELEVINSGAFTGISISVLVIPESVTEIAEDAFSGCDIENLTIEAGNEMTDIMLSAGRISSLVIPANVERISVNEMDFIGCIRVDPLNTHLLSSEHFLFSKHMTRLLLMNSKNLVEVIVPRQVRVLGSYCFSGQNHVRKISCESGSELRVIESRALASTSISSFLVPKCVEEIKCGAFDGCDRLRELILEEDCALKSLTCAMFDGIHLRRLVISSNVASIEANSLRDIDEVEICERNKHLTKESLEFLRGRGMSTVGYCSSDHVFVFSASVEDIPSCEFELSEWNYWRVCVSEIESSLDSDSIFC